jgi:Mannosyltransferase (PIG-V)
MGYEKENRKRTGVGFVLLVYAASRLFYLLAGALLARLVPVSPFHRITSDVPSGTMNLWSHWDGEHYVALAAGGYLQPPENVSPAFFPLYPLLMRSVAELFGGPVSEGALSLWGPLVSLLFLPLALFFVYRIAEDGFGEQVARATTLAVAFFPTTFFLNSAYTESLFLALSAGSLWACRVRKDLLLACVLAALAGATRNVGVFLMAPLFIGWLKDVRYYRWRGVYLALAPSGLIVYAGYLWWRFGDPLLFYTDQGKWGRQAAGPLATAGRAWEAAVEGSARLLDPRLWADPSLGNLANNLEEANNLYNLVFFVFAGVVLLAGLWELPPDLSVYTFLLVAPATLFGPPQSPLMGTPRYVLVAFPLFIVLGLLSKNRPAFVGWLVFGTAASLVLCALFVSWRFVA